MPTGAVPLLTAAQYGGDVVAEGVVQTLIEENPLLEVLPWRTFAGNALIKRREGTLPLPAFRQVNNGYTASFGTDEYNTWGVAILGSQYEIDNYEQLVAANEFDLEAEQIRKHTKAMSMRFTHEAILGTHSAGIGFTGLKQLVTDGHGQLVTQSAGAMTLAKLDEAIDAMQGQYQPTTALVSQTHTRKITNLVQANGSGILLDVTQDERGRRRVHYAGIPLTILRMSRDVNGATVDTLGFHETSSTSSIYFVALGEDTVCGLMGAGGSISVKRFGEMESAPARMGRLEWYPGIASFDPYGLVRYENITNA